MKKYLLLLFFPVFIFSQSYAKMPEYIDAYERPMTSYAEWAAKTVRGPFSIGRAYKTPSIAVYSIRSASISVILKLKVIRSRSIRSEAGVNRI